MNRKETVSHQNGKDAMCAINNLITDKEVTFTNHMKNAYKANINARMEGQNKNQNLIQN